MTPLNFDIDALMARLGEKRARRANAYYAEQRVDLIAIEDGRAIALVTGETDVIYPVEVRDDGEGECTCPDFPNERTCKHVGAAALAADALSMREARALDGRLSSLRAALEGEDRAALIHLLMDLARSLPGAMALLAGEEDEEAF